MFAVIARFNDSSFVLLGFRNSKEEVEALIDEFISEYGAEALGDVGVKFNVELAV